MQQSFKTFLAVGVHNFETMHIFYDLFEDSFVCGFQTFCTKMNINSMVHKVSEAPSSITASPTTLKNVMQEKEVTFPQKGKISSLSVVISKLNY